MGPTLGLSAPDGLHVGPMNLAIKDIQEFSAAIHTPHICHNTLVQMLVFHMS